MIVTYRIRDDLMRLIVCLYNPFEQEMFSTDTLHNYISACGWQLEQGEQVKRIPFHITPSMKDAERAIDDMRRSLQAIRKELSVTEGKSGKKDQKAEKTKYGADADFVPSWPPKRRQPVNG